MDAPKGNKNAVKGFQARQALELALSGKTEVVSSMVKLVSIWNKMIDEAETGDSRAANMIMDRLDGKPGQSLNIGGELGLKEVRDLSDDELSNIASSSGE